ncbi:EVE domain-containing protein [Pseudoalteromonas sp. JBTF-M23]|uniref:EVE domain-containing protein n=1 Tax=Pseudoalteromonas caenipelagi TaxID=2726988 RepID=A0A849VHC7_9GAMM|nr:EVE domain-containing protein [Pseudoalteromonas caenipelagi]NOU51087.1 EVE domain-containing protein [Pseudoalteromonas caenipelagi]
MAYWLFKTEPDTFSIDDLKALGSQGAFWEGVRNYQARNFLRDQVKLADLVFIYHSSCKVPAIVGIAKVIQQAQPDPFQFDIQSDYFDAKSTKENPRWYGVTLEYVKHLRPITLSAIKANLEITELALKKAGRLSIMPVSEREWHVLCPN